MKVDLPFDLSGLWTSLSGQLMIVLAIAGVVVIILGVFTQGWMRAIGAAIGILVVAMFVISFGHLTEIGHFLYDGVFNTLGK
ncbi:hypothetical protein [Listeria sp. ILCC797]|uniref:hypothetical protein n=1 Tax=Listeria sp. ILCC797 TaxID=1918333 RepID=UPI000B593BEC|nr:hypothetical protein [Listeria sp. ILCC797]